MRIIRFRKKIKGKGYEYIGIDVDKTAILSASREYTIINNDTILPKNVRKKQLSFGQENFL